MSTITSQRLCELTGATYRQIDYWARNKIIPTATEEGRGSGSRRQFDKSIVPAVRVLARVSRCLEPQSLRLTYKGLYAAFDKGTLDLGDGIVLTWTTKEQ